MVPPDLWHTLVRGTETRYPSSKLEALGVVWATRHFRHYLYGHKYIVFTDNIALKSLLATPHPLGKLARWGMASQELDITIKHRSGKENRNADALSRNPVVDLKMLTAVLARPGCPTIVTTNVATVPAHREYGGTTDTLHCKNEGAVPTPFVVSSLCECDTWCSPNTPGCHTSTLGCHLSTLGCHCSTHGVTLAPLGCHHSTKSWCHIRTHDF